MTAKPDPTAALDPSDPLVQRAMARAFPDRTQDAARLMAALREVQLEEQQEEALADFSPFTVHFVASGLTVHLGQHEAEVTLRGQELKVTAEIFKASLTGGRSIFDYSDDEQIRQFGEVKFRKGPWPADVPRLPEEHSLAWQTAKQAAYKAAYSIQDRSRRALAIQQVVDTYGEPSWNPGVLSVGASGE